MQLTEHPDERVVGIDVGGTKTHIRVVDRSGTRDLVIATDVWRDVDDPSDTTRIGALALTLARLGVRPDDPLVMGAHGCDSDSRRDALEAAVRKEHGQRVAVFNDAELIVPAAGHDRGIAIVMGTGSIVVGATDSGTAITAGGHGWMLSDPGSAAALSREAVKRVLRRHDEGLPPEMLGRAMMAEFVAEDVHDLSDAFTRGASIHRWAAAAPLVFEAADAGSQEACRVIEREAHRVAELVAHVVRRGARGLDVIATGGVIVNQPRIEHSLATHLHRLLPTHRLHVLAEPPVAGAIRLARNLFVNR
ncbi:N-acetylglucosamine kinase [Microbacterium aurantiacum]|uniref:ATPase BadF/BadG/BcrA/BcrD type domain-containing protein n=1 Tax=Microbacterium aurantiacum TaxID=162393 RepID=A0AAJ2HFX7_9MICO|nr:BadF/BadG/BcrA/BcrD ATPase family protein [Microbacterium aurantiacum]MDS0244867.1 hypothetical protein [Microbacterium aurantiacum]